MQLRNPVLLPAALYAARAARNRLWDRYARWEEDRFDRRYGIETRGIHDDLAALGASGEHLADAYGYEAIQPGMFRAMLRALDIEPSTHVFVDFGSGKGRAVFLAAQRGFRASIGVELAPALHEVALRNLGAFRRRAPRAGPIDLCCGDAAYFPIPDADAVFCFFNPFGERVLRKVAANIEGAYRRRPRSVVIAYRNPVHPRVFEERAFLRPVLRNRSFAIYRPQ